MHAHTERVECTDLLQELENVAGDDGDLDLGCRRACCVVLCQAFQSKFASSFGLGSWPLDWKTRSSHPVLLWIQLHQRAQVLRGVGAKKQDCFHFTLPPTASLAACPCMLQTTQTHVLPSERERRENEEAKAGMDSRALAEQDRRE